MAMIGKGKYDKMCTLVRGLTQAKGVILIIKEGCYGNGFSAQFEDMPMNVPSVLRQVADTIEKDLKEQNQERTDNE